MSTRAVIAAFFRVEPTDQQRAQIDTDFLISNGGDLCAELDAGKFGQKLQREYRDFVAKEVRELRERH